MNSDGGLNRATQISSFYFSLVRSLYCDYRGCDFFPLLMKEGISFSLPVLTQCFLRSEAVLQ